MVGVHVTESLISDGCIIENATISHSVIGIRSIIGSNTTIENSLVMGADYFQLPQKGQNDAVTEVPPIGIGSDTHIRHAIIDKNARIGHNVRIINRDEGSREDEGIWIKDGIVIVAKNSVVPHNTVI